MSKHNNKPYHNYSNYSANTAAVKTEETKVVNEETEALTEAEGSPAAGLRANVSPVDEAAPDEITETIKVEEAETEDLIDEPVTTTEEDEQALKSTPRIGSVNCGRLRMRKAPNTDADIICELTEGSEVQINEAESTDDFYKVTTPTGAEGFCMKKFITIK